MREKTKRMDATHSTANEAQQQYRVSVVSVRAETVIVLSPLKRAGHCARGGEGATCTHIYNDTHRTEQNNVRNGAVVGGGGGGGSSTRQATYPMRYRCVGRFDGCDGISSTPGGKLVPLGGREEVAPAVSDATVVGDARLSTSASASVS